MNNQIELVAQDSVTKIIYNLTNAVQDGIGLSSECNNGPNKLTFKYINEKTPPVELSNGSIVRFTYKGVKVFYGYVFTVDEDGKDGYDIVAYDSLRYLKYKDSKVIKTTNNTLTKLLREIINERKLRAGTIETTSYAFPPKLIDNQTYLDMLYDMISDTLLYTGKKYILYDNFGSICLIEAEKLKLPLVIGEKSFLRNYNYTKSIDGETYNIIKLARDNKKAGTREHFQVQDSFSIAKWGMLQYYNKEDNLNDQQMKDKATKLLKLYNREEKKLKLSAMGDVKVMGGRGIYVDIPQKKIRQWFMVQKVSHEFFPTYSTMEVELVI